MKVSGHGNAVAIALSGLAVVLAATGTAYAVTAGTVHIADPKIPSRVATVDGSGRLSTVGVASTVNTLTFVNVSTNATASAITSPTTASFAVTRVAYYNPGLNTGYANTNFAMSLVKINAGKDGTCYASDASVATVYTRSYVGIGSSTAETYASPLIVKPTGTTKFCLGVLTTSSTSNTNPTSYWNPSAQLTAWVNSGTYTGTGLATSAVAAGAVPHTTPQNPHPAGVGQR